MRLRDPAPTRSTTLASAPASGAWTGEPNRRAVRSSAAAHGPAAAQPATVRCSARGVPPGSTAADGGSGAPTGQSPTNAAALGCDCAADVDCGAEGGPNGPPHDQQPAAQP